MASYTNEMQQPPPWKSLQILTMPSKLERFSFQLKDFTTLELEWIKSRVSQELQSRSISTCRLLTLPRELRDRIYYFYAMDHLSTAGAITTSPPLLLLTNKQLQMEFMNVYFSHRIIHMKCLNATPNTPSGNRVWNIIKSSHTIRRIFDRRSDVHCFSTRSKAMAEEYMVKSCEVFEQTGDVCVLMDVGWADERGGRFVWGLRVKREVMMATTTMAGYQELIGTEGESCLCIHFINQLLFDSDLH